MTSPAGHVQRCGFSRVLLCHIIIRDNSEDAKTKPDKHSGSGEMHILGIQSTVQVAFGQTNRIGYIRFLVDKYFNDLRNRWYPLSGLGVRASEIRVW